MKETGWNLYQKGVTVTGARLNDSLSHVFDVFEEVKADRATAQLDTDGELHFTKVKKYVTDNGVTHSFERYEGD